jgi:hypothetical protein
MATQSGQLMGRAGARTPAIPILVVAFIKTLPWSFRRLA